MIGNQCAAENQTVRAFVLLCAALCVLGSSGLAQERAPNPSPLAPGHHIYVQPLEDGGPEAGWFAAELTKWGRWTVVTKPEEADLFARLSLTGSIRKGTMAITISQTRDGPTLWQGQDAGRKNPYRKGSAFARCLEVIVEQLRTAADRWPQR